MLETYIAELSAFLLSLTLEQELLLSSAGLLSMALALLRIRRQPSKVDAVTKTEELEVVVESSNAQVKTEDFSKGLTQSRGFLISKLTAWLSNNKTLNETNYTLLEEILISADLGVQTSQKIVKNVLSQAKALQLNLQSPAELMLLLKNELITILTSEKSPDIDLSKNQPTIILIVGVNGAGKTTTIAKISKIFKTKGKKVLVAAADTFRAAAIGQLNHWAERIGVDIEYKEGENIKPATIVFDAISRLKTEKQDVLIIDTAGRLHNRVNLMNELESIKKSIQREFPDAPHETLLVLDGSSGQNALQQAREFNERVPLTGIVITKLDGTSKGGIVVAIRDELNLDVRFIGLGESEDDLILFNPNKFIEALLNQQGSSFDNVEEENDLYIQRKVVRKNNLHN